MTASVYHQNFFLNGPAGRLEATVWTVAAPDPPMAALACHPHPLFGGTMHNKVVFQVARALHRLGLPVLRFNFRGAGLSDGEHDEGRGEIDDVRAALDWLAARFPAKPIVLAGFSFGAVVGLRAGCGDERVKELVALGLPVDRNDFSYLRECAKPKLFLQGGQDQFGDAVRLRELVATLPEPKRLVVVPGVDHFFTGKLGEMAEGLRAWMTERHPRLASPAAGPAETGADP
ncbi:MAG TPA: alpha/beta fold hydrolase [Candidatus Acidoferrales bacterium]|nr:alpha/beta fold hydrolase [Candidatus Acidoferrales bacterium]